MGWASPKAMMGDQIGSGSAAWLSGGGAGDAGVMWRTAGGGSAPSVIYVGAVPDWVTPPGEGHT